MRIGRIGHASLTFTHGDLFGLMDPILIDPFECGRNSFNPPVEIDVAYLREHTQVIVISHAHFDHFSPRSLALLDRRATVLYPEGASLIELALARLGFEDARPMQAWRTISFGEVQLTPTPSLAPFPELGLLFRAGGHSVWNLVDTDVDEGVVGYVRAGYGSPDLLLPPYQPLIEEPLTEDALGGQFPYQSYADCLSHVWSIRPKYVIPGSFGFRFSEEWLNQRGFPITEQQFASDLRQVMPELEVLHLPHGGAVEVGDSVRVEAEALPYARRKGPEIPVDWRPDKGVPPLVDRNPLDHSQAHLRAEIHRFLEGELLPQLSAQVSWRERLARIGAVWRLEVLYPHDPTHAASNPAVEPYLLSFEGSAPLKWAPPNSERFAKLHTSVTASGLVGMLKGEISIYAFRFNELRFVNRLFEVSRSGVTQAGTRDDEPLTLLLQRTLDQRFIERELDQILAG